MGKNSSIQWTHHTFSPWIGCQRVSPGCEHCYAEAYDKRVGGAKLPDGTKSLRWGPKAPRVRTSAANWRKPLAWNLAAEKAGERHRVFCSSLADVFEDRPELVPWRAELFDLIARTPHLDWLLLTKRPEHITPLLRSTLAFFEANRGSHCDAAITLRLWLDGVGNDGKPWPPPNVWLGTTVEDQQRADERIPALLEVPAAVRFLSCEPLLDRVDLKMWPMHWHWDFRFRSPEEARAAGAMAELRPQALVAAGLGLRRGIDWVIIGGESGPKARPFDVHWARDLLRQCRSAGVAPFVKQLGANVRTRNDDGLVSDFDEGGWFLDPDRVEEHVNGYREDHQGAEVRVRLVDPAGGDMAEWPEDLRVREFPRG